MPHKYFYKNYLEGIVWVTKYYFEKCPTWDWQYKFTHAPFLSDLAKYLKKEQVIQDFKYVEPIDINSQLVSEMKKVVAAKTKVFMGK